VRIAVLNGPNLNLLGVREPDLYGRTTLSQLENSLAVVARDLGVSIECSQANGEGALIDIVHGYRGRIDGAAAVGVVVGLGTQGYELALRGLVATLTARGTIT